MKRTLILTLLSLVVISQLSFGQDRTDFDNSEIAEACSNLEYITELLTFRGMPINLDPDGKVLILINHAYIVGYSLERNQPLWAAYRVSKAKDDVDYERPLFFYDDLRLPESSRIGTAVFGGGYDRGHMVPNYAINKQFGRLAQVETFVMSNMCPQKDKLNRGVWAKLEMKIVSEYAQEKGHIWIICGPIFPDSPTTIERSCGIKVPIPSEFYMILVDPIGYPYTVDKINFIALKFPQLPDDKNLDNKYITYIDELEKLTKLNFFPRLNAEEQKEVEPDEKKASEIW